MSTMAVCLTAIVSLAAGILCLAAVAILACLMLMGAAVLWVLESIIGD